MAFERDRFVISWRGTGDSKGDAASGTVTSLMSDERRRFTRADAREVTEVASSHVAMLSHPDLVIDVIRAAAKAVQGVAAVA
jgi:hypothetical protein